MENTVATRVGRFTGGRSPTEHYAPGTIVADKYQLETVLGEGGMGTIWLARNVILDAPVALKLIRSDLRAEETFARLLVEARVEAKLRHPNIVRVYDFGRTEHGDAFIVMEVLYGIGLDVHIGARKQLSPTEAVQLLLPVIDALSHAHENGVVHRDVKPGNIFLERAGHHTRPKLLDFGIAKLGHDAQERGQTQGGTLLGSPPYMAPEQALGAVDVDHRVDIWAVCVVLYEAITGGVAFRGEGYELLRAVIEDEVEPLQDSLAGEASLWPIIARGMAKDRDQRFQSMFELSTELAQWLSTRSALEGVDGNGRADDWGVCAGAVVASPIVPLNDQLGSTLILSGFGAPDIATGLRRVGLTTAPLRTQLRGRRKVVEHLDILQPPAAQKRRRSSRMPSLALAVSLVLVTCFAPSKAVEAPALAMAPRAITRSVSKPSAAGSRAASLATLTPAPSTAVFVSLEEIQPRAEPPRRATRRLSETDLGLKEPY